MIGRLAKGGMAEAYLALSGELPALRSLVVVKRILPHLSSQARFVRMFFDEARIGVLLDHPNIVRIIEVGRDGDGYFLAMEPVQGRPLSAVLRRAAGRRNPLGPAQAAFIVGQAANGLGYAHALTDAQGDPLDVVHRDISPENILVSFDGAVKVIDFGIASALGRITETVPGGLKGKIEYMSPEQASGGAVDRRSDIFALGVVLWEALCGRRLFRRATELETMRAIVDEPIPRPPRSASVPGVLERIVMRALEKEPEHRFQDAREMALLLQQAAFATPGFNLVQLASQMKRLFPADHAGWKAAANAAVDVEGKRPRRITSSFSFASSLDSHTAEPTVALRGDSGPAALGTPVREEEPSDVGEPPSVDGSQPAGSPRPSRWWIAGSIALVGLICWVGSSLLAHPRPTSLARLARLSLTNGAKNPVLVVPIPLAVPLRSEPAVPVKLAIKAAAATPDLPPKEPAGDVASRAASAGMAAVQPSAVPVPSGPAVRWTELRRRVPARRPAKVMPGKGKLVAAHRKVAPTSPPASAAPPASAVSTTPPTPTTPTTSTTPARPADAPAPRPPWHDPFD